ncbi:MAG: hypothetical protein LUH15_06590 [Tannerellaceae bacterium]|nr:hypothetical protein [Tannerellaceae bacterium]
MEDKLNSEYFITNNREKSLAEIIKGILLEKQIVWIFWLDTFIFPG